MNQPTTQSHQAGRPATHDIALTLRNHNVTFILPAGARLVGDLDLANGGVILGEVIGNITCGQGSLIVDAKGHVRGRIEADRIYVAGRVSSGEQPSQLIGRKLVAAGNASTVQADIFTPSCSVDRAAFNGTIHTLDELADIPSLAATAARAQLAAPAGSAPTGAPAIAGQSPRTAPRMAGHSAAARPARAGSAPVTAAQTNQAQANKPGFLRRLFS
jgi:hypothetical protein